jgi:hypothetical protein
MTSGKQEKGNEERVEGGRWKGGKWERGESGQGNRCSVSGAWDPCSKRGGGRWRNDQPPFENLVNHEK